MAFFPINPSLHDDRDEQAADDSPSDHISLDLSGAHTEAAALEHEPMRTLTRRLLPGEYDLTALNLDQEP